MKLHGRHFIVDGHEPIYLTPWQATFLGALLDARGNPLQWGDVPDTPNALTYRMQVYKLRRVIPHGDSLILTATGHGYFIHADDCERIERI